ncbi:Fe-S cluster assembly protein SufD [Lysobacter capsici]|uniref:Fe-S cluster assembly protein SufD n=2 Tax=Lysobacter capsici TaxID=435897 RepID=UPI00287B7B41|nr:Fe-S cluster assembly protein SufD [Lysobacter capsici]WND81967.1 Fe-S cluster assembly protein SufD [Lysobacter capsici]WND87163.1 Fe-S cluster assembly protein SufD [Lysobacter capsici]
MSALLDAFVSAFDALPVRESAGLGATRRAALDAALRDGLPGPRTEAWKYTPLRALERRAFVAADAAPAAFDSAAIAGIPAPRIVFHNGRYDAAQSDLAGLPAGVSLQPLSQVLAQGDVREANFLARRYERADEVFARLNAALADEGAVLRVDAGVQAQVPVHLVFVGSPAAGDRAWHLRHLIELREGASLTVVEHQLAADSHTHLSNSLTHVHLAPNANLSQARVQDEALGATVIARTDAVLAGNARYRRIDLELGAALSRHELNAALHGEAAQVHANGVLLATGRRHLDTRLGIDHVGRDTQCELIWRGLGAGRSRAAFHGGILIREGADGSNAMLSNKNLLLSEGAEIDTQPVLEIHADEVQAAHGATVGQLDANALFYLRSRGVPAEQARALLTTAFCRETLSLFEDDSARAMLEVRLNLALERLI